ncbi:MAG: Hcp family type VI secretion system effector [Rhizobiaceae bacterium]|nr:Hcp family type VI secretion system effector [Rhizobiaceae bacterium]
MPMPAYVKIEGEKGGLITAGATTKESMGEGFQDGHTDEIMVQAFSHSIIMPRDVQSGDSTGFRVHQPFSFVCTLNKAVPLLYNALAVGDLLKVEMKWYRTENSTPTHFFTTALEGAKVVDINLEMPHCQDLNFAAFTQLATVKLSYRKINWDHVTGNTSGSDDWRDPAKA